jgi:membrane-associated phospholipid phosphatase
MLVLLLTGTYFLFLWTKDELFWALNQQHSYPGDLFFKYFTHIGDGLTMVITGVLAVALGKRKLGVLLILSFLLSGLLAQVVKRVQPEPRPGKYFTELKQDDRIHRVDGRLLRGNNSFPSGHTTTAFAMFSLLAFASRNYPVQFLCFVAAIVVGYSRIYLGQHFYKDVFTGALLGYASSLLLTWFLRNKEFDR